MSSLLKLAYALTKAWWFFTRPITVGVRVMLIRGETILLVRHSYQAAWYFPGGGVKKGETLEQAIRREAAEEAGATLAGLRLVGTYTDLAENKSDHIIVFACDDFTLTPKVDYEIERCEFFPLGNLPPDTAPGCRRCVQNYRQGNVPGFGVW